jgi:hypothetical protein
MVQRVRLADDGAVRIIGELRDPVQRVGRLGLARQRVVEVEGLRAWRVGREAPAVAVGVVGIALRRRSGAAYKTSLPRSGP